MGEGGGGRREMNNTLLTAGCNLAPRVLCYPPCRREPWERGWAGCCKSELRYLKHWYRLLCRGLVKPILGKSGYMRLFHTPRTSFLLTTRLWKHNSCSVLFLFQERTWELPLEPFWIPLLLKYHMKSKHWWKISMASPCRSPCSYLIAVGDVREYCFLSNHCHIQILDVSHDFLNGFVSGLPFSSPLSPI